MRPFGRCALSHAHDRPIQTILCRGAEALRRRGSGGLTMAESYDRDADRARLLDAALGHVAFDGWSETALRAAAQDTGIPLERAWNAFPGGATELIAFHSATADRVMLEALEREPLDEMKVREKAARAIRLRL